MSEATRVDAFGQDVLNDFAREEEVDIETRSSSGRPRRVTIWIVVDDGVPYIRSVHGEYGRWYRDLLREPHGVIHVAGHRIPVRAVPADDESGIVACSRGLAAKYSGDPSTPSMLRPEVLGTTLRLVPDA